MDTNTTPTTQTLVAIDFGRGDTDALIRRMSPAVVATSSQLVTDPRRGAGKDAQVVAHRFEFDTSKMRNTVAHGHGCAAGFIVHVEDAR